MTTSTRQSPENWKDWVAGDRLRFLERLKAIPTPGPGSNDFTPYANDPLGLARDYWPDVRFYDKQIEIIESVRDNVETVLVSAHQMGKDFTAGFTSIWAFLVHPVVRIITTSVADHHLRVLFAEINRFIQTCRVPLIKEQGGPLIVNHRDIRKAGCAVSYLRGLVSERGEGMAGHHAPYTLLIIDECSGVDDIVAERGETWAKRRLYLGNPYPCQNFFYRAVKGGDVVVPSG